MSGYWSLGYEFWYYVLYATGFYFTGKKKWISLITIGFFIGPKILLLFPIWILGVYIYHWNNKINIGVVYGFLLFVGSFSMYFLYRAYDGPIFISSLMEDLFSRSSLNTTLRQSQHFPRDYIVGILIATNFFGFAVISKKLLPLLLYIERPIRFLASYTFTLYLLHYPLLHFFAAVIDNDPNNVKDLSIILSGTLVLIFIIGSLTEHKKHLFRLFFQRFLK